MGFGFSRRDGWSQCPGSGREGGRHGLSHSGNLYKGAKEHSSLKGCLFLGPEYCLPTNNPPACLESFPGKVFKRGQLWEWQTRLLILGIIRRKSTHLSGSLMLPNQRNLNQFNVINNNNSDSNYKIYHDCLFMCSMGGTVLTADVHGLISSSWQLFYWWGDQSQID